MFEHLSSRCLLIVSDTAMVEEKGMYYVYEPVWREVEALASAMGRIIWIGARTGKRSPDFVQANHPRIQLRLLPRIDYPKGNKFRVLAALPRIWREIRKARKEADLVHSRAPSHPAALNLLFPGNLPSWHKYAGDWLHPQPPCSYALQRWMLRGRAGQRHRISVNARRDGDPEFILSLPNPCLWRREWELAEDASRNRTFSPPFRWVFAGNLQENKGIIDILDALDQPGGMPGLASLAIAGRGPLEEKVRQRVAQYRGPVEIRFLGALARKELNAVFADSDFLVLPSRSEGFPKVVAEAAAQGCIPLVPEFPSLQSLWIEGDNAFFIRPGESLNQSWDRVIADEGWKRISLGARARAADYSYEKYLEIMARDLFPASLF